MNALVVYDSQYGNTEKIARAIHAVLETPGSARIVFVASTNEPAESELAGVDLLVVGGPTLGHAASKSLRAWVDRIPESALRNLTVATFDTRLRWPVFLSGSAARGIAAQLRRNGARMAVPPESFFVSGREGPLEAGELDRASAWAKSLASALVATAR